MSSKSKSKLDINFGELVEIGILRSVAGFGLGLLAAEKFGKENRRRLGWLLFFGSVAAGLPTGIKFLKKNKEVFNCNE